MSFLLFMSSRLSIGTIKLKMMKIIFMGLKQVHTGPSKEKISEETLKKLNRSEIKMKYIVR